MLAVLNDICSILYMLKILHDLFGKAFLFSEGNNFCVINVIRWLEGLHWIEKMSFISQMCCIYTHFYNNTFFFHLCIYNYTCKLIRNIMVVIIETLSKKAYTRGTWTVSKFFSLRSSYQMYMRKKYWDEIIFYVTVHTLFSFLLDILIKSNFSKHIRLLYKIA